MCLEKVAPDAIFGLDCNCDWHRHHGDHHRKKVIYSILILNLGILLTDFVPKKLRWIIPSISLLMISTSIALNTWPYGIEYLPFNLFSWQGVLQILSSMIVIFGVAVAPDLSRGLFAILAGMIQILRGTDWFNIYVGFEIILMGVMCFKWDSKMEYLYLQILASTLILFGIGNTYIAQGHFGNAHIPQTLLETHIPQTLLGNHLTPTSILLFLGLVMKIGFWPFNRQLELYKNAPKLLFIFLSSIVSKASMYCLSLFSNHILYSILYCANSIASSVFCLRSKTISDLTTPIILYSNTTFLLLLKYCDFNLQASYIVISTIMQLALGSKRFQHLSICLNYLPLGVDFIFKMLISRHVTNYYELGIMLVCGCVFGVRVLNLLTKGAN